MRRLDVFVSTFALSGLLLVAGCMANQDGPSLFNNTEDLDSSDSQVGDETTSTEETSEETVVFEDGGEFGILIEGTQCTLQLHGGCVPFDYYLYEGIPLGLHFVYPQTWLVTAASERAVTFTPSDMSKTIPRNCSCGVRPASIPATK